VGSLGRIFFRGLVTLLPIAVTIYILYSAIVILDNLLGHILREILTTYIPGLGLIVMFALTMMFGLLLNNLVVEKFLALLEKKLLEVPLFRAVYAPLKDLMNLFSKQGQKGLQQVVFVRIVPGGPQLMGLITRDHFEELKLGNLLEGKVAVYLPFSYGIGGYTVLAERKDVQPVDLPIEKAMSLAITGWVKVEKPQDETAP
jgi:uncharacterized membrane protein